MIEPPLVQIPNPSGNFWWTDLEEFSEDASGAGLGTVQIIGVRKYFGQLNKTFTIEK